MNLLENKVGRPSNETLEKRRKFYVIITLILALTIISSVCFVVYYFDNKIEGENKNAYASSCVMPYTRTKCKYARNATVKKVQEMLTKLNYYKKSYGIDGNFGPKTVAAVKKFQKSQKITQDGHVGPDTLERLAKATNTKYYKILYNKNGGTGTLKSQYNNIQIILGGMPLAISSTKLTKKNYTHVGYTVATTVNGAKYRLGCFNKNCPLTSPIWANETQIKSNKNKFYDVVYSIGQEISMGNLNVQTITLTAKYCNSGETYNRTTSSCEKKSTTTNSSLGRFVYKDLGDNCHGIYAPNGIGKWDVHVYYMTNSSYKLSSLSASYTGNSRGHEICFDKQKKSTEKFRILVRTKDSKYSSYTQWRPSGWSYNKSIGWAYKDFTVNWGK